MKLALIRDNSYPAGVAAPMHLECQCGATPTVDLTTKAVVRCTCGRLYNCNGWMMEDRKEGVSKMKTVLRVSKDRESFRFLFRETDPDDWDNAMEDYRNDLTNPYPMPNGHLMFKHPECYGCVPYICTCVSSNDGGKRHSNEEIQKSISECIVHGKYTLPI